MAEYTKDREFSWGWMLGGTALMFVVNWFAGFCAVGAGVDSLWGLLALTLGSYAVGGFVIGWQSEGHTVIEAGLAAVLAICIGFAVNGLPLMSVLMIVVAALPFGAACLGAWIGELVQGNVIVRDD